MTNIKFVIKATTPEAMRDEIVKWLNDQALAYQSAGRISRLKKTQARDYASATALEAAARFIAEIVIEKPKPVYHDLDSSISVDEWLKQNKFIAAIKKRRTDTGEGLKEAKDYCEQRRKELGLTS